MSKNLWTIENDQVRLQPHPGQAAAWRSRRRFVFVLAGTQGGKTSFGPWWLWREINRHGAGDYLAVTASYDLFKLKMLPELRLVFEHVLGIGRYWSADRVLELKNPATGQFSASKAGEPMWGRIILRSAESPAGLESATAKAAWCDECGQDAFTLETWDAVQRRLSLAEGRVLGTTTLYNTGWLKSEIYDAWTDGDKTIEVVQFPSIANPAFPRQEFERRRTKLQAWRFAMFYLGKFAIPAGQIYPDWGAHLLVDPFAIPSGWRRAIGVDFGGANTAVIWLAQDPGTEIWYLYREYLAGAKTTQEHARVAREGIEGATDLLAAGGAASETQARMDWAAAGLPLEEPAIDSVEAGIDRVTELLKTRRLRVFRSCRGCRDEFGSYRRKLDTAGNPTDEIVDKRAFHRLDGLRYAVVQIAEGGGLVVY